MPFVRNMVRLFVRNMVRLDGGGGIYVSALPPPPCAAQKCSGYALGLSSWIRPNAQPGTELVHGVHDQDIARCAARQVCGD